MHIVQDWVLTHVFGTDKSGTLDRPSEVYTLRATRTKAVLCFMYIKKQHQTGQLETGRRGALKIHTQPAWLMGLRDCLCPGVAIHRKHEKSAQEVLRHDNESSLGLFIAVAAEVEEHQLMAGVGLLNDVAAPVLFCCWELAISMCPACAAGGHSHCHRRSILYSQWETLVKQSSGTASQPCNAPGQLQLGRQ